MVSTLAPGPWTVRLLPIANSVVNTIRLATVLANSNVILLPSQAVSIASRSEWAPVSLLLVTTGSVTQEDCEICKAGALGVAPPSHTAVVAATTRTGCIALLVFTHTFLFLREEPTSGWWLFTTTTIFFAHAR